MSQKYSQDIENYNFYLVFNLLNEINKIPIEEKQKTLLWIPKSNELYWRSISDCRGIPFIAPALTGIAMLDGYLDENCSELNYGYLVYENTKFTGLSSNPSRDELCKTTVERGFSQLIILESKDNQQVIQTKVECK